MLKLLPGMWSTAVWIEKKREEEGVVPSNWIKDDIVFWPNVRDAEKSLQQRQTPGSKWHQFKLVKIKHTSG